MGRSRRRPDFEFSVKLYQKFTHPAMFKERVAAALPEDGARRPRRYRRRSRGPTPPTSTSSGAASIRWHRPASSAPLLAQFPASFKDTPASRDYLSQLLRALRRLSASRSNCGTAAGATPRRHAGAAERVQRRVGADRRAEVPVLDPPELPAERQGLLLHAAARPERREVVAARQVRRPLRLPLLGRRTEGVLRDGRRGAGSW